MRDRGIRKLREGANDVNIDVQKRADEVNSVVRRGE
jgi:hypothetical protein